MSVTPELIVKAKPDKSSEKIASINQWENLVWSGDSAIDREKQAYYKVRLSDGKLGWVSASGSVVNGVVMLLKDTSELYSRADSKTPMGARCPALMAVAAFDSSDSFTRIAGPDRNPVGWVLTENLTTNATDLQAAIASAKILSEKSGRLTPELLVQIKNAVEDTNSFVIKKLQERIAPELTTEQSDSIQVLQVPQTETGSDMTAE